MNEQKTTFKIEKVKQLTPAQHTQVDQLWDEEYPKQLNGRFGKLLVDVDNFTHYLISDENKKVLAWSVVFDKDQELRFSILVNHAHQGKKLGQQLIQALKNDYQEFYGWVIDHSNDLKLNGEFYRSPLDFYKKLNFEILHDQRIDSEMLKAVKIRFLKGE